MSPSKLLVPVLMMLELVLCLLQMCKVITRPIINSRCQGRSCRIRSMQPLSPSDPAGYLDNYQTHTVLMATINHNCDSGWQKKFTEIRLFSFFVCRSQVCCDVLKLSVIKSNVCEDKACIIGRPLSELVLNNTSFYPPSKTR